MSKLKGSSNAVKMKYLIFVFAASVIVGLPTRVYQLLALVDPDNGFYAVSDATVPLLYVLVFLFPLAFLVLSYISREVPSPKLPAGKNVLLGGASLVMVGGLIWDIFLMLYENIPANQGNAQVFAAILKHNLSQNGGIIVGLRFILAFASIVYLLVFSISHLNGRASYKEFKLLSLSPLCWSMTILVSRLKQTISFVKVSDLLFEIGALVFLMLFMLTFARISSGVFTVDSMWGIYGYGLTASFFLALITIPRLVMIISGVPAVEGYEFDFTFVAVLVFVLSYIFASLGIGYKDGLKNRQTVNDMEEFDSVVTKKEKDDEVEKASEEITVSAFSVSEIDDEVVIEAEDDEASAYEKTEKTEETDIEYTGETISFGKKEKQPKKETEVQLDFTGETISFLEKSGEKVNEESANEVVEDVVSVPLVSDIPEQFAEEIVKADEEYVTEDASAEEEKTVEPQKAEEKVSPENSEDDGELKTISLADLRRKKGE